MNRHPISARHRPGLSGLILSIFVLTAPSACGLLPPPGEGGTTTVHERGESDSDNSTGTGTGTGGGGCETCE